MNGGGRRSTVHAFRTGECAGIGGQINITVLQWHMAQASRSEYLTPKVQEAQNHTYIWTVDKV